jgi:hypothetical protein
MLIGLLLGLATPSPAPALPPLKTITHIRATPFCSALRSHIGPAIDNLLAADSSIAQSPTMIHTISRDGITFRDYPRTVLDMAHLESLITPLVKSTQETQKQLDAAADPGMTQIRLQLQAVLDQQKDALNTISGLVDTFQMGEVMNSLSGPPPQWQAVLENPNGRGASRIVSRSFGEPAATALFNAAPMSYGKSRFPAFDPNNVGLGFDPYAKFADKIVLQQKDIAAKESTASQLVLNAAQECSGD